jgi:hypothetical protein
MPVRALGAAITMDVGTVLGFGATHLLGTDTVAANHNGTYHSQEHDVHHDYRAAK